MRAAMVRGRAAVVALAGLVLVVATVATSAQVPRVDNHSPLRAGARPGCRWVVVPAKTSRVCDRQTGVCRVTDAPAQRTWVCGTVRD